ncbi:protein kinase [Streptomyces sp. ODS28]|uniref:protein kinase n=1 Tax=Streptomyces sp. ODS28 TaxID=3136688 RepID=UPI0031EB488A
MDEYGEYADVAGRLLADRYRLPHPPAGTFDSGQRPDPDVVVAFDTASDQEVLVRRIPLPEVVEAEVLDPAVTGSGRAPSDGSPGAGGDGGPGGRGVLGAAGRATRRPADPTVRRAVEAAWEAARLPDHPRLDQVYDVFVEGEGLWVVSELVPSRPLSTLLERRPLEAHRAAEIAADLLAALRAVHAHGWTHRNITARTVLICEDGRAVLSGLAAGAAEEALCGYDPLPPRRGEGATEGAGADVAGEAEGEDGVGPGHAQPAPGRMSQERLSGAWSAQDRPAQGRTSDRPPREEPSEGVPLGDGAPQGSPEGESDPGTPPAPRGLIPGAEDGAAGEQEPPEARPPAPSPYGHLPETWNGSALPEGFAARHEESAEDAPAAKEGSSERLDGHWEDHRGQGIFGFDGSALGAGDRSARGTAGRAGPHSAGGPYGSGDPYGAGAPSGPDDPYGQGAPYGTEAPYGRDGSDPREAPYGDGDVPYGDGDDPYGSHGPYGEGTRQGWGSPQGQGDAGEWHGGARDHEGEGHEGSGAGARYGAGERGAAGWEFTPGSAPVRPGYETEGPYGDVGADARMRAARRGAIAAYRAGARRAAEMRAADREAEDRGTDPERDAEGRGGEAGFSAGAIAWWSQQPDPADLLGEGASDSGADRAPESAPDAPDGDPYGEAVEQAPASAVPDEDVRWLPPSGDVVSPTTLPGPRKGNSRSVRTTWQTAQTAPGGDGADGGVSEDERAPEVDQGEEDFGAGEFAAHGDEAGGGSGAWAAPREVEDDAYRGPATALAAERARHARMTMVGAVTERWAPEQAGPVHENWRLAPPVGPAADLWALGALLFRAVQGHAAYPEENVAELVQMVCAEPPAFAEECGPLRPVVESLMRQDPTERPDFEELRGWLRSLVRSAPEPDAGHGTVVAPPSLEGGRPSDPRRLPILRRRGELVRRRRGWFPWWSGRVGATRAGQAKEPPKGSAPEAVPALGTVAAEQEAPHAESGHLGGRSQGQGKGQGRGRGRGKKRRHKRGRTHGRPPEKTVLPGAEEAYGGAVGPSDAHAIGDPYGTPQEAPSGMPEGWSPAPAYPAAAEEREQEQEESRERKKQQPLKQKREWPQGSKWKPAQGPTPIPGPAPASAPEPDPGADAPLVEPTVSMARQPEWSPDPGLGTETAALPKPPKPGRAPKPPKAPKAPRPPKPLKKPRAPRSSRPPRDPNTPRTSRASRRLGRWVVGLVLFGLTAGMLYATWFMPKQGAEGDQGAPQRGSVEEPSAAPSPEGDRGTGPGGKNPEKTTKPGTPDRGKGSGKGADRPKNPGPAVKAPKGFKMSKDPAGFQIAVPQEWNRRSTPGDGQVRYNGGRVEMVVVKGRDTTREYGEDPTAYQSDSEPELAAYRASDWATTSGLRRIDVGETSMAEGTFGWQDSGRQVYARNRATVLGGRYHVLMVMGDKDKKKEIDRIFEAVADTYRVTR